MTTRAFSFLAALAFTAGAYAQDLAANAAGEETHSMVSCLMSSNNATWQSLGLDADRSRQAQAIADGCTKEHQGKAMMDDAKKDDMTEMHVQELQKLLTADEFAKWKDWCGKKDMSKAMDK
ncbi:MAG TPA: hypothetical protein PK760_08945 [Flavobacteriales bacterium]|nr:hypothetical protein [Flavobacteriales bacterium]